MALPLTSIRDTLWFRGSQVGRSHPACCANKDTSHRSIFRDLAVQLKTYLSLFAG